ncbi:MAG: hypothetical protein ACFFAY_06255 [Promethearchaeota archaeon]
MNKREPTEEELDKLLLVLSKPLTRLILSVLSGRDPGLARNKPSLR